MNRTKVILVAFVTLFLLGCEPDGGSVEFSSSRMGFNFDDTLGVAHFVASGAVVVTSGGEWVEIGEVVGDSLVNFKMSVNRGDAMRVSSVLVECGGSMDQIVIEQLPASGGYARWEDSVALVDIYKQCSGEEWYRLSEIPNADGTPSKVNLFPWNLSSDIGDWQGVTTQVRDGQLRVTGLNLGGVGMTGVLPLSMENLQELQVLQIGYNELSGDVMTPISGLDKLIYLDLVNLSGSLINVKFDSAIFPLLKYLILDSSISDGEFPSWIWGLDLVHLSAAYSVLDRGALESALSGMRGLEVLNLSFTDIGGEIPAAIYDMGNLTQLEMSYCDLRGSISERIEQLSNLRTLKLVGNSLSGAIPVEVGGLKYLEIFNLAENKFTLLPVDITSCKFLSHIDVSFNNIEAPLFEQWAALEFLESLTLLGNRMSGVVPEAMLNDSRWSNDSTSTEDPAVWYPRSLILPQQVGYGFD